jgi:amino acid transporter
VVLTLFEAGAIVLIGGLAIWNARAVPATAFSWHWFFPSSFGTFQSFSAGMLVALFFYFGWGPANLAEETAGADTASGIACILGVFVIVGLFLLAQVAVQMALTPSEIQANGSNLLPALGAAARHRHARGMGQRCRDDRDAAPPMHKAVVLDGRDGVIGETVGKLHPRFQTPWIAGFAVVGVSLLLFAGSATVPSVNAMMGDLINAIGVQVAIYYALAGIACAWHYRKSMRTDWRTIAFAVIVPLTSALFVACVGIYQLPNLGWRVSFLSIGSILIGVAPFLYYRRRYRSRCYYDECIR